VNRASWFLTPALAVALAPLASCLQPPPACHGLPTWPGEPPLNEPAGFRALSDQPWNALDGNGWHYLRRTSSKSADICVDDSVPGAPLRVLRIIYTPDMQPNTEPGVHWTSLPLVTEIYTAWWMKLSPNWNPNPAGGGKITFLWAAPEGQGQVYTNLYHPCSHPEECNPVVQGPPYKIGANTEWSPYGQKIWYPNVTTTWVNPGEWHRIEFYYKWGLAGTGVIRWWVDGVLNGDHRNVAFPLLGIGFYQFEFGPTVQEPPPEEQYMYVGHTYMSAPALLPSAAPRP
jgi:hypothetical protein